MRTSHNDTTYQQSIRSLVSGYRATTLQENNIKDHKQYLLGFTVIELVVVIGILLIIASLLLPAITRSRKRGGLVTCLSNQQQIGIAFSQYSLDNQDYYPTQLSWATSGGARGISGEHGGDVPPEERPLNRYASPSLFLCPQDSGTPRSVDKTREQVSCYMAWGNSYLVALGFDVRRVRHVTGTKGLDKTRPETIPIKGAEIAISPSNKTIQGDWPWLLEENNEWHKINGSNVLFGDGHVSALQLHFEVSDDQKIKPDPNWVWW